MKNIVIGIGILVVLLGLAFLNQAATENEVQKEYLQENRLDVVAAIEAYHAANGHYPDSITNAVPAFYHGNQVKVFFLNRYDYKNLGASYELKKFK